jgi:hypothetical protein
MQKTASVAWALWKPLFWLFSFFSFVFHSCHRPKKKKNSQCRALQNEFRKHLCCSEHTMIIWLPSVTWTANPRYQWEETKSHSDEFSTPPPSQWKSYTIAQLTGTERITVEQRCWSKKWSKLSCPPGVRGKAQSTTLYKVLSWSSLCVEGTAQSLQPLQNNNAFNHIGEPSSEVKLSA